MQTGIISFGDRVAWNIKCNFTKDLILNELLNLYNVRIIQKHYYVIDDNNIKHLTKAPHLISLRTNGNKYYIYFTNYNDIPIIYFIDMKIHTGYEKPRIILGRGLFDTLLDGEMIKTTENKWVFIINDIIAYEGNKMDNIILPERLKIIYTILETKYTPDEICDVCSYKVKNYYYLSKKSLNELLTISKDLNYTCRGIYFSSYYIKHKPKLFNFNEDIIVAVQKKVKDITEFKELELTKKDVTSKSSLNTSQTIISTSNIIPMEPKKNEDYKELWISKTDDPDIYNIYDNHNILTSNKIGIAFVGTLQESIKIRNIFKDKSTTITLKFKCVYNEKFKKYKPIEQII